MKFSEPRGIIFLDFDGTLFGPDKRIHPEDIRTLQKARDAGYLAVIATGRNLFSIQRATAEFSPPLQIYTDFIIFSSGAGVLDMNDFGKKTSELHERLIESTNLDPETAFRAAERLFNDGIDFMIHQPVPDNHRMIYIKANGFVNPDFYRRINTYQEFSTGMSSEGYLSELETIQHLCSCGPCQLLGVLPFTEPEDSGLPETEISRLRESLPQASVIRTTSPIDNNSIWVEVFSSDVSKSAAAERFAKRFKLGPSECLAIGNDYNDEDLIEWAGSGWVVDEAPRSMRARFRNAGSNRTAAVAAAIRKFCRFNS